MANNVLPEVFKKMMATQAGSLFVEGIRNDIDLIFSRDQGPSNINHLVDVSPSSHSFVLDPTEGRITFSIDSTPGEVCYHESDKKVKYEAGHMILGGQTIKLSAIPIGDGKVEWGFGESDGIGNLLNAIGMGVDAVGVYTFRKKGGAYEHKVYENSPENSIPVGSYWDNPVKDFNILNNNIMGPGFEWYGVASPHFFVADEDGYPQLVHVLSTAGKIVGTTVPEPSLPLFVRLQGDSVTGQALSVDSGCWRGGVFTNKTTLVARNPSGDYTDSVNSGTYPITPEPGLLLAGQTYNSNVMDTEQYPTILLLVTTDQVSALVGSELQWSDTEAFTFIRAITPFAFRAGEINSGKLIQARTKARYLRIVYKNGANDQGRFFLNLRVNTVPLATDIGLLPSTSGSTGQQDVNISPAAIATSVLSGRWGIRIRNLSSSARPLFYGFDLGLTILNGDELAAGEAVEFDLDEFTPIYVVTASTAGGGVRCAWTQLARI